MENMMRRLTAGSLDQKEDARVVSVIPAASGVRRAQRLNQGVNGMATP